VKTLFDGTCFQKKACALNVVFPIMWDFMGAWVFFVSRGALLNEIPLGLYRNVTKATSNLCFGLYHRFLDVKVMAALGMVYLQYWICEETIISNFLPHLNLIKYALCVNKKLKGGSIVLRLLDSRQLDVQASHFKLTMNHNVEVVMQESKDVNLVIHM
jgi:hypothetical protein